MLDPIHWPPEPFRRHNDHQITGGGGHVESQPPFFLKKNSLNSRNHKTPSTNMLFVCYAVQTENPSEGLAPDHQSYTRLCFWQGIHRKVIASDFAVQQEFFETVAAQNVCLLQTVWWWPSEMKDASGIYKYRENLSFSSWKDWCNGRYAADTWQISFKMMIAFQMRQDGQHVGKEATSSWQVTHTSIAVHMSCHHSKTHHYKTLPLYVI